MSQIYDTLFVEKPLHISSTNYFLYAQKVTIVLG